MPHHTNAHPHKCSYIAWYIVKMTRILGGLGHVRVTIVLDSVPILYSLYRHRYIRTLQGYVHTCNMRRYESPFSPFGSDACTFRRVTNALVCFPPVRLCPIAKVKGVR